MCTKNASSYFLSQVISDAEGVWDISAGTPRACSVWGVATPAAFRRNWSVSKVLEAVTWRSNPVFNLFYFKDLLFQLDNCNSLGSFVAAGSVPS